MSQDYAKANLKHIVGLRNLRRLTINFNVDETFAAKTYHREGFCPVVERYLTCKKKGVHLETLSLNMATPSFDMDSEFEYCADYEWDAQGELVRLCEYHPDKDWDNSSEESNDQIISIGSESG